MLCEHLFLLHIAFWLYDALCFAEDAFLMVGRAPSIRWVLVILVGSALSFKTQCRWGVEATGF